MNRYLANKNTGVVDENAEAEFKDKYDLQPNTKTCIVYEENTPVASARACIYSSAHYFLPTPAFEVYRQEIETEIGLDKMIIEATRLVIHPEKVDSKYLFKLPFRFIILNIIKFSSDYIIIAVRSKHVPIYPTGVFLAWSQFQGSGLEFSGFRLGASYDVNISSLKPHHNAVGHRNLTHLYQTSAR